MNNTKVAYVAILAFLIGSEAQVRYTKAQLKKKLPPLIKSETDKIWSEAFHSGYNSAVEDPSVRYQHYNEFKGFMNQE